MALSGLYKAKNALCCQRLPLDALFFALKYVTKIGCIAGQSSGTAGIDTMFWCVAAADTSTEVWFLV